MGNYLDPDDTPQIRRKGKGKGMNKAGGISRAEAIQSARMREHDISKYRHARREISNLMYRYGFFII